MLAAMKHPAVGALIVLLAGCDRTPSPKPTSTSKSPSQVTPAATSAPAPSILASAAPSSSAQAGADAARFYFRTEIKPEDLEGKTLRELAIMRNTIFARAGNRFRRPWLNAYFSKQGWYKPRDQMDRKALDALDHKNAKTIASYDAAMPTKELEARRDAILSRQKSGTDTPEDAIEISLLSQRFGRWQGKKPDRKLTPLEDPSQLDKLVSVDDLKTLSRRDLRMLRNTVYARHHWKFGSKVVRNYFKSSVWYRPSKYMRHPAEDPMVLTGIDHKNVKIIRSVENELGGPEHENPEYGKESWFYAA